MSARHRQGLTVLELLVVVAILGVLAGLLLPAVVSAREATRRITCANNLRQLGIAIHHHHDARRAIPAAWTESRRNTSLYGWTLPLLPFMEKNSLYESVNQGLPITSPSASLARTTSLEEMLCPSDITTPSFPLYVDDEDEDEDDDKRHSYPAISGRQGKVPLRLITRLPTANYVGVFGTLEPDDDYPAPPGDGVLIADRSIQFADLNRGLSRTLMVGERTMAMIPSTWLGVDIQGEDATCRLVGAAITRPNCDDCDECEFASRHSGGVNFLWADGHVGLLSERIDSQEYRSLARRRGPR